MRIDRATLERLTCIDVGPAIFCEPCRIYQDNAISERSINRAREDFAARRFSPCELEFRDKLEFYDEVAPGTFERNAPTGTTSTGRPRRQRTPSAALHPPDSPSKSPTRKISRGPQTVADQRIGEAALIAYLKEENARLAVQVSTVKEDNRSHLRTIQDLRNQVYASQQIITKETT